MLFADDAALTAHTEEALQRLVNSFAQACEEFGLTISLKKTDIMGQDVNSTPSISIGDHTLEVVTKFTYLGSTISSNLSLDVELNTRIGKAATAMAHLASRVWDNSKRGKLQQARRTFEKKRKEEIREESGEFKVVTTTNCPTATTSNCTSHHPTGYFKHEEKKKYSFFT
ncbi:hypothetical protein Pmani_008954 [Petrolisthes manimaculis]|uniref:Reverse transcriptase domain-containing protein n=1 Tax=Petrolisthes manimaculis TaxID=1843537 RepID=A0AAE1Q5D3_9EUCA|nr:hypothetical protein Pmani_008954 [Petrolisthes manimaculis]